MIARKDDYFRCGEHLNLRLQKILGVNDHQIAGKAIFNSTMSKVRTER